MRVIQQFLQIPLPDTQRKRTDIFCSIISVLLPVTIICWAFADFNREHLLRANFPADSRGNVCGYDLPEKPFLRFPNPSDPSFRVCVAICPFRRESEGKYEQRQQHKISKVCSSQDYRIRRIIQEDSQRNTRRTFFNVWESIRIAIVMSILVGFLYFLLVQLMPYQMGWIIYYVGGVASIYLGVLIYRSSPSLKHANNYAEAGLASFFVIAGLAVIVSGWLRRIQTNINAVFISYSTLIVRQVWPLLFYIPLFLLLVAGLVTVTLFELFAFWSHLAPVFDPRSLYWLLQKGPMFTLKMTLVGIQLVWGLNFIAQAFNFCVSGTGVDYYFGQSRIMSPLTRLVKFHWGSVVGGSFVIGFLGFFDAFFDFLRPITPNSLGAVCCSNYFSWIYNFFDIVRHDAMAYINITGLPYCNAARYCDFLSQSTPLFGGSQSISRLFRFSAHLLLTSIVTALGIHYVGYTTLYSVIFSVLITYFTVEMFASLHPNIAQGMCISFLTEEYLESGDFTMVKRAPPGLVDEIRRAVQI